MKKTELEFIMVGELQLIRKELEALNLKLGGEAKERTIDWKNTTIEEVRDTEHKIKGITAIPVDLSV